MRILIPKLVNVVKNPFFLAGIVFVVVLFLIPPVFDRYSAEIIGKKNYAQHSEIISYNDLNNNGASEKIRIALNQAGLASFRAYREDESLIEQWNFNGSFLHKPSIKFGDFNNNKLSEAYIFTRSHDSVFINCIEPYAGKQIIFKDHFILKLKSSFRDSIDLTFSCSHLEDMNNDGYGDLIFDISAGFAIEPRGLYIFDIKNDTLFITPKMGSKVGVNMILDINDDGFKEIITSVNSPGNIKDSLFPYIDYSAWLMVFDHQLHFLFPPVEFKDENSTVNSIILINHDQKSLIGLVTNSKNHKFINHLIKYDLESNRITKFDLPQNDKIRLQYSLFTNKTDSGTFFLVQYPDGIIFKVNQNFDFQPFSIKVPGHTFIDQADINMDQNCELILINEDNHALLIFSHDLTDTVRVALPSSFRQWNYSIKFNGNEHPEVHFQTDGTGYFIRYGKNPWFVYKYPFFIFLYLGLSGILFLIRTLFRYQNLKRKIAFEKTIAGLQLQTYNSQLDPHFTFNALTAVSELLIKNEAARANDLMIKISQLMRSLLKDSDNPYRTIEKEVQFTTDYLSIQKVLLDNHFSFTIEIDESINIDWLIPRLSIQIYAENAVKHGIRKLERPGNIAISINSMSGNIIISIEDNGVGRKAIIPDKPSSTGMGLKIMNEFYNLLNKYNRQQITEEITDLYDDQGNAQGTRVVITVPEMYNFRV